MSLVLAAAISCGIALPHTLPLREAPPTTAIAMWFCSLTLRAVTGAFIGLYIIVFFPQTQLFNAITHWCWHTVLPLLTTHMGMDGHRVGDAAVVLPSFILAASFVSVAFGVARAAGSVRRLLDGNALGVGPQDSVIVGGQDVFVAAAGLVHPRIVVSAGALTALEDDELAASLDHERGHIDRRHRFLMVLCELCRAVGRFVPGARRALDELSFHLERDADHFALARHHDRLALASAICKAATAPSLNPALTTLGGAGVTDRLHQLLDESVHESRRLAAAALASTATVLVALTITAAVLLPATAIAGAQQVGGGPPQQRHCPT